ncbi:hypothetical protein [Microbacterium sp. NPDC079995]|uniref:hypothetical protein n=1 Tax=Microbacterium sp. NPDC079995 TaxID=3155175 RepID=UPI00344B3986
MVAGIVVTVSMVFLVLSGVTSAFYPALLCLLPIVGLVLLRRDLQTPLLSPVWITVGVLSATGFFGYVLADKLEGLEGGGMTLRLTPEVRVETAILFALSAGLIVVGAAAVVLLRRAGGHSTSLREGISFARGAERWILPLTLVPMVLVVGSLGDRLVYRTVYLAGGAEMTLFGLGQQLAIAAAAVLGYVAANSASRSIRIGTLLLLAAYIVVFLGMGSRRLALIPLCFAIGYALAKPRRALRAVIPTGLAAVLLLPLPLFFRDSAVHGLVPYASKLAEFSYFEVDWPETLNNVLIAFPTTGITAFGVAPIPLQNLVISLNPAPGGMAGWYDISRDMNLNAWTPFSAVGELGNYGQPWLTLVWVGFGVVLGSLEMLVTRLLALRQPLFGIAIVGLSALFALQSIQYGLRLSSRMIVYAVLAGLVGLLIARRVRPKGRVVTAAPRQSVAVGLSSNRMPRVD